jgi:hypothetical protein
MQRLLIFVETKSIFLRYFFDSIDRSYIEVISRLYRSYIEEIQSLIFNWQMPGRIMKRDMKLQVNCRKNVKGGREPVPLIIRKCNDQTFLYRDPGHKEAIC